MIRPIAVREAGGRKNFPSRQNRQSLTGGRPIFRREILGFRELAVSEPLSNLEVEPEWCSAAVLTSISAIEAPVMPPAEVPTSSQPIEPVVEVAATEIVELVETPKIEAAPEKPKRAASRSRSHSEPNQPISPNHPTGQSRWLGVLRSRKFRIGATVASVLFVGGLIVLNLKRDKSALDDAIAEMDLSEFNTVASFDEPHAGALDHFRPLGLLGRDEIPKGLGAAAARYITQFGETLPGVCEFEHGRHFAVDLRDEIGRAHV